MAQKSKEHHMTPDKEHYEQAVKDLTASINNKRLTRDELNKASRNLIMAHIKLNNLEEAKILLQQYFTLNRYDLLLPLSRFCQQTNSPSLAEELIGDVRCYSYTWMDFAVQMQQLYMDNGEFEKARIVADSIQEIAMMSIRPATKALAKSFAIAGRVSDSNILKELHKQLKAMRYNNDETSLSKE
jgi:tetratricopeptide (TPR) repeat protein